MGGERGAHRSAGAGGRRRWRGGGAGRAARGRAPTGACRCACPGSGSSRPAAGEEGAEARRRAPWSVHPGDGNCGGTGVSETGQEPPAHPPEARLAEAPPLDALSDPQAVARAGHFLLLVAVDLAPVRGGRNEGMFSLVREPCKEEGGHRVRSPAEPPTRAEVGAAAEAKRRLRRTTQTRSGTCSPLRRPPQPSRRRGRCTPS